MGLTERETKELTLKLWRFLATHPERENKQCTPMYEEVSHFLADCPLCEYFKNGSIFGTCKDNGTCPLLPKGEEYGCQEDSVFFRWHDAHKINPDKAEEIRQKAAEEIVRRVEAWQISTTEDSK